ncbi:MAG: SURF1 family protein [Pseudomonadota bacterium]
MHLKLAQVTKYTGFLVLFALLCSLGVWQLSRAAEKDARYQTYVKRLQEPALDLDALPAGEPRSLHWIAIRARGEMSAPLIFLDNRIRAARAGYEVLQPFQTVGGARFLVNRGWLSSTSDRATVPAVDKRIGQTTLTGRLGPAPASGIAINDDSAQIEKMNEDRWRLQRIDFSDLSERFDLAGLSPLVLYLDANNPIALETDWSPPGNGAARHHAYAVQWFAMAGVLVLLFVLSQWKRSND